MSDRCDPSAVRRLMVLLLVVGLGNACNRGASPSRTADAEIDALFAEWNRPDSAGYGVGVNRGGTMVFERGYGMANLEEKIPITPATLFDPASIAKPFTALSVMLLFHAALLPVRIALNSQEAENHVSRVVSH
jgi:CubicO group peptidase (beta-lactamase class C family)